ncbi:hypothetical protein CK934_09095 [Chitinophaga sp. MD30]|nr:hypothetical protein CK934_09095 [Chitinophaga sp. MD30]
MYVYQDTLQFMQASYATVIGAITTSIGNNVIISGCEDTGSNITDGWIIYNGVLLPFIGGLKAPFISADQQVTPEQFDDNTQKPVYYRQYLRLTNTGDVTFASLVRLSGQLDNQLTLVAVSKRISAIEKMLMPLVGYEVQGQKVYGSWLFWGRPSGEIPEGWEPVPDQEWKGRVPVVLDQSQYEFNEVGKTGGEKYTTLSVLQLPPHRHFIETAGDDRVDNNPNGFIHGRNNDDPGTREKRHTTEAAGQGEPHNNLQPYKVVMFIRFKEKFN